MAVASVALLGGCAPEADSPTRGAEETASAPRAEASSSAPTPASNVRLTPVTCAQWEQDLAAQRGKIVVVDTWATWCVPCREEFPQLVALHRKHAAQGVVCMSVSVDEPDAQSAALDFLTQQQAEFANYRIDDKSASWWDKWEIRAIPVVLVFRPDGTLAKKFDLDDPDHQFTYADVEKLVDELLAENPSTNSGSG